MQAPEIILLACRETAIRLPQTAHFSQQHVNISVLSKNCKHTILPRRNIQQCLLLGMINFLCCIHVTYFHVTQRFERRYEFLITPFLFEQHLPSRQSQAIPYVQSVDNPIRFFHRSVVRSCNLYFLKNFMLFTSTLFFKLIFECDIK